MGTDPSAPIPPRDRNGLEILSRDECLQLLSSVPIARIAMAVNDVPIVLPVNFVVDGGDVVVRSSEGSKLDAAVACAAVAVEADAFDGVDHHGWSVIVKGRARELTTADEVARARALPLRPWGGSEPDHYVAVSIDLVSGRRVGPRR